jgi:hypothetical protein
VRFASGGPSKLYLSFLFGAYTLEQAPMPVMLRATPIKSKYIPSSYLFITGSIKGHEIRE